MPVASDLVYKDRDTILAELAASFQARIPDINLGEDSVARIWMEVMATTVEGLFLANQLLHDDMFPQTSTALALMRWGELWGRPIKGGTQATGTLRFSGVGGTIIPTGTIASAPSSTDESLSFATTAVGTIPAPGIPAAPVAADGGAGGLTAGTYEYGVTFTTALGETALGLASNSLVLAINRQVGLSAIPLGGVGTVARKVYRRKNGGTWGLVTTINNNTTTTFTDNVADGSLGGTPPADSTAEQIDIAAAAEDVGVDFNVGANTITEVSDAVTGVVSVTNAAAFTGGTDQEDIEVFRAALLDYIRSPKSGSVSDLEAWAETVLGVESATAFSNDNLGTPQNGHATVRITGPGGSVPSGAVIAAVLTELQSHDIANITLHVGTFTTVTVAVTADVTLETNYSLADVTPAVTAAVSNYLLTVPIGGIVRVAGLIAAIFGLPGIATVTVTAPATDVGLAATEKAVAGTVTVV